MRLQNIKMVEKLKELAAAKGLTAGQLALAWVHNQGDDVVPIPGKGSKLSLMHITCSLHAGRYHVLAMQPGDMTLQAAWCMSILSRADLLTAASCREGACCCMLNTKHLPDHMRSCTKMSSGTVCCMLPVVCANSSQLTCA